LRLPDLRAVKLTSKDNPMVRHWAKLASDGRYRKSEGRALIEGPHLVQAALQAGVQPHAFLVSEKATPEIANLASKPVLMSDRVFASIVNAETPQGIAAEISIPVAKSADGDVVFLEGVQDPGNVGTIMRSAAAFGAGSVILDRGCADAWSPKTLRSGMGAHFALQIRTVGSLEDELQRFAGRILCAVPKGGVRLDEADLNGPIGWLFGSEGQGVSPEATRHTDLKVSIPMVDGTESLNVAAAAAICFYDAVRRRTE
jgi:TrmH family RNA methyltransferase